MRVYFLLTSMTLGLLLLNGCLKDELTVGNFDEGTIKDLPTTEEGGNTRRVCVRRELIIDVVTLLDTNSYPNINYDLCGCDTLDIRVGDLPKELEVVGFVKITGPNQTPSKKRLGIVTEWWGQLILGDPDNFLTLSIPIHVDLKECN